MQLLHQLKTPLEAHGLTWTHLRITLLQVSLADDAHPSMRLEYQLHNEATGTTWPRSTAVTTEEIELLVERSFRLRSVFEHLPHILAAMLEPQIQHLEPQYSPQVTP
jgi:hypothetical protein